MIQIDCMLIQRMTCDPLCVLQIVCLSIQLPKMLLQTCIQRK